jgi:hypothetical protein
MSFPQVILVWAENKIIDAFAGYDRILKFSFVVEKKILTKEKKTCN